MRSYVGHRLCHPGYQHNVSLDGCSGGTNAVYLPTSSLTTVITSTGPKSPLGRS